VGEGATGLKGFSELLGHWGVSRGLTMRMHKCHKISASDLLVTSCRTASADATAL
jgi:hypothetical protein